MKAVGRSYVFLTDLVYNKKHHGKDVLVTGTNGYVYKCVTEEGNTFVAFNSELKESTRAREDV